MRKDILRACDICGRGYYADGINLCGDCFLKGAMMDLKIRKLQEKESINSRFEILDL